MTLGDHLRELRRRLIIAALAITALAVVGWYLSDQIIALITAPMEAVAVTREDGELVTLNLSTITEAFAMRLKVALFAGIIMASPIWLWQVWAFLLPGLTRKEKAIAFAYFFASIPLFLAGAGLAGYVFPRLVAILLSFTPENITNIQNASDFMSLVLFFMVAFGLAFLLPVVLVGLNQLGIMPARAMLRSWRIMLFGILVFSAFMTPDPQVWPMLAMAAPVFALYWGAVGVAFLLERGRRKKAGTEATLTSTSPEQSADEASPRT